MVEASELARNFIFKWKSFSYPSPKIAESYLDFCRDLLFMDESLVRECVDVLRRNMEMWALENSRVYLRSRPFYEKEHMEDKDAWYVQSATDDSTDTQTSGSSTGFNFIYRRTASTFDRIEWDNHYDMVLDEFGVLNAPHVLYFFPNHFKKFGSSAIFCDSGPQPYLNSHGRSRTSIVHYANFDLYKSDPNLFFESFTDYVNKNSIDVVFTSGPQVNSLCHHLRRLGFEGRIAGLLSHTNERLIQEDASFLLEKKYFDHVCDHMRCWDGGASFFTCRDGNYHLMDNLSWCEDVDGRLVSTDYFNFSSPFVRYWNGDVCSIGEYYQRCDCGRLYRNFDFLENRPFSLNGICLGELRRKMMLVGPEEIKQVKCYTDRVDVVSERVLTPLEKEAISLLEPNIRFEFVVEN